MNMLPVLLAASPVIQRWLVVLGGFPFWWDLLHIHAVCTNLNTPIRNASDGAECKSAVEEATGCLEPSSIGAHMTEPM